MSRAFWISLLVLIWSLLTIVLWLSSNCTVEHPC